MDVGSLFLREEIPMYTSARKGERVNCNDKCLLNHNGVKYPCILENISISGALIGAYDFPPADIRPGDTCGLLLCSDSALCSGEFKGKITRLAPSKIGLYFLGITF